MLVKLTKLQEITLKLLDRTLLVLLKTNRRMNAASALGQNLANQLGTASGDKGGLKGKANIADLLEQKRKGRRGGLSRSGTSRTLITGKV